MLSYLQFFITVAAILSIATLGLNLQWGVSGQFNAGVVGFIAVGGYALAILTMPVTDQLLVKLNMPFAVGLAGSLVVSALVAAIAHRPADHVRTVDVGSGVRTTIGDLAREIARYHSAPEPHVTGQYRDGDVRHASCTVEATVRTLDWQPRVSLRDGVAGLQEWIATQLD